MIDEKNLIEKMWDKYNSFYNDAHRFEIEDTWMVNRVLSDIQKMIEEQPKVGEWIPCSEKLPEERDWYLAVFKERDTGFIGLPYIADYLMGKHTTYTTNDGWIIKDCTDRYDCESEYHKGLECVAWMPLPEPYKE